MSDSVIEHILVETGDDASRYSVVWLHGLGADGQDFSDLPNLLDLPEETAIRFLFPHAPLRPITLNGGMVMRGWYDLKDLGENEYEDIDGLNASSRLIYNLIEVEVRKGIPVEHILLGGFSQGGAVSLYAGLRYPKRLAGIVSLSGYLPAPDRLLTESSDTNRETPIFLGHGIEDTVVPLTIGNATRQSLDGLGYGATWWTYPMSHTICQQEMIDLSNFLERCLPRAS